MRSRVVSSRTPALLLASGAVLSACNLIFGIEPGERSSPGGGGSAGGGGVDLSSSSSAGDGGNAGTDIAERFDYPGEVGWAFSPRDASGAAHGVAYDAEGNMLFTGTFTSNGAEDPVVDFGGGPKSIEHGNTDSAFVAKYDGRGTNLWLTALAGPGVQRGRGIAADATGAVFVTGSMTESASFPLGDVLTGDMTTSDLFVAKLAPGGEHVWSKRFGDKENPWGDSDDQWGVRTAVDSQGNVIVAGAGKGNLDLGDDVFRGYLDDPTERQVPGIFVLKLDNEGGNVVWSWKFPVRFNCGPPDSDLGGQPCDPVGLAIDASDNIVLAANTTGDPGLGRNDGTAFESSLGGIDIVVWKLDAGGVPQWGRVLGGEEPAAAQNGDQWASAVAVNPAGEILMAGGFKKSVRFGGGPDDVLRGHEDADIFLAKLSADGDPIWAKSFGDLGHEEALGIAVDALSNVAIVGLIRTEGEAQGIDFGDGNRLAEQIPDDAKTSDVFVAKFSDRGTLRWARRIGNDRGADGSEASELDQAGMAIALDRSPVDAPGSAAICGWFFGTVTFGPGPMNRVAPGYTPFMAKYGP